MRGLLVGRYNNLINRCRLQLHCSVSFHLTLYNHCSNFFPKLQQKCLSQYVVNCGYFGEKKRKLLYPVGACAQLSGRRRKFSDAYERKILSVSAKDFVAVSPSSIQPYLRLLRIDKPIGTWLVFLPCAWSLSLAAPAGHFPDGQLFILCALGAFFMRGAGCAINDMWDKDFDSQVARTKDRPIASGEITRLKAFLFLSLPLSASLAILLTMNNFTIALGFCAVIPCIIYPLMKRITYWPQLFLGLTFNWGVLVGWTAVQGTLSPAAFTLYISSLAWTLIYDTIYAFQDIEDDVKVGVKSSALFLGEKTKPCLTGFAALISAGLTTTGLLAEQSWPYYVGVSFFTTHLLHQIYTVNLNDGEDCGNKFRSNRTLGLVFLASIIASNLLKSRHDDNEVSSAKNAESL